MEGEGPREQSVSPKEAMELGGSRRGSERVSSGPLLRKCQGATLPGAGPLLLPG